MKPVHPSDLQATAEACIIPGDGRVAVADAGRTAELIMPLHGLRGIAAFTVLAGHLFPLRAAPSLGVVLFFLLSGFLMGRLYLSRPFNGREVIGYACARLGRIYPLFALVVLLAVAIRLTAIASPFDLRPEDVIPHLLFAGGGMTIWTISVEVQFYALFVLVWFAASRMVAETHALWIGISLAIATAIAVAIQPHAGRIELLRYLHLFIGGLMLSVLLRRVPGQKAQKIAAAAFPYLLCAYALAFFLVPKFYDQEMIYADPLSGSVCAAVIYCAVAAPVSEVGAWLSSRWMVRLGELSFGLYLFHRIAQALVQGIAPDLPAAIGLPCILLLTFLAAQLANRWVENPARRTVRLWGQGVADRFAGPQAH